MIRFEKIPVPSNATDKNRFDEIKKKAISKRSKAEKAGRSKPEEGPKA